MEKIKIDNGAAFLYPMPTVFSGLGCGWKGKFYGGRLGFKGEFQAAIDCYRIGTPSYE